MNENKTAGQSPANGAAPSSTEALAPVARQKGFLKTAFTRAAEIGAGAAVMWVIKACTAAACASLLAAPATGIIISAVVVGTMSPLVRHGVKLAMASKEDRANIEKLTMKKYLKQAAISTAFGAAGAGVHYYFDDISSYLKDIFFKGSALPVVNHTMTGAITPPVAEPQAPALNAPATPAAPEITTSAAPEAEPASPAATPEPAAPALSSLERMQELGKNSNVSDKVKAVLERVDSPNKRVSAQAIKDLGYFAYNGLGGVPKDQSLAVELFKQAAEAGNIQAKIDLAAMEFHGNPAAGVPRNVEGSLEKLEELAKKSKIADRILGDLVGPQAPIAEPHAAFIPEATPAPAEIVAPATSAPAPSLPAVEDFVPPTPAPVLEAEQATVKGGLKSCISHVYNGVVHYLCSMTTNQPVQVGEKFFVPRGSPLHPAMNIN